MIIDLATEGASTGEFMGMISASPEGGAGYAPSGPDPVRYPWEHNRDDAPDVDSDDGDADVDAE